MCLWFSNEQLPFAFGMVLFANKLVRAINDNLAPLVYNQHRDIEAFFWIGLWVCYFSSASALLLAFVHGKLSDQPKSAAAKAAKRLKP